MCTSGEQVHDRAEGLKKKKKAARRSVAPGAWFKHLGVENWLRCKMLPTWMRSLKWLEPRSSAPSQNTPPSDGPGRPGARTLPCDDTHKQGERGTSGGGAVSEGSREGARSKLGLQRCRSSAPKLENQPEDNKWRNNASAMS